jgi:hypothetical protein
LTSHGIAVLHIPFSALADSFASKGVNLRYPEKATDATKAGVISKWDALTPSDLSALRASVRAAAGAAYTGFMAGLREVLSSPVTSVCIIPMFGHDMHFASVSDALAALADYDEEKPAPVRFRRFEVMVRFSNGDTAFGNFGTKDAAVSFLNHFL